MTVTTATDVGKSAWGVGKLAWARDGGPSLLPQCVASGARDEGAPGEGPGGGCTHLVACMPMALHACACTAAAVWGMQMQPHATAPVLQCSVGWLRDFFAWFHRGMPPMLCNTRWGLQTVGPRQSARCVYIACDEVTSHIIPTLELITRYLVQVKAYPLELHTCTSVVHVAQAARELCSSAWQILPS